jgi:hypothetical protein
MSTFQNDFDETNRKKDRARSLTGPNKKNKGPARLPHHHRAQAHFAARHVEEKISQGKSDGGLSLELGKEIRKMRRPAGAAVMFMIAPYWGAVSSCRGMYFGPFFRNHKG